MNESSPGCKYLINKRGKIDSTRNFGGPIGESGTDMNHPLIWASAHSALLALLHQSVFLMRKFIWWWRTWYQSKIGIHKRCLWFGWLTSVPDERLRVDHIACSVNFRSESGTVCTDTLSTFFNQSKKMCFFAPRASWHYEMFHLMSPKKRAHIKDKTWSYMHITHSLKNKKTYQ